MTTDEARDYLESLANTAAGRQVLRDLGYGAIVNAPRRGDDTSTLAVATKAKTEFERRYGI
jgi:hypothetical protein